ncbi:MAG TPA: hypothetical protein VMI72_01450 [Roseiarcus sp.]|nr:hypothetical protein [Roseiarcus sp.]
MREAVIASAVALLGLAAVPAQAMPFGSVTGAHPGVTLVAQGCGPGWHRNYYGRCIPNGYGYVAPHVYRYGYYGYHPYHPYYGHPYARPYGPHCWWRGGVRVCR